MPKADDRKNIIRNHKIKQLASAHPNSRKASHIHQELLHNDKKAYHLATKKVVWMDQKTAYTKPELLEVVVEYITRNDDELREAIKTAKAGGGSGDLAKTSKTGMKLGTRKFDEEQLRSGELIVPDLMHAKVVRALQEWKTGNIDHMLTIKTVKFGSPEAEVPPIDQPRPPRHGVVMEEDEDPKPPAQPGQDGPSESLPAAAEPEDAAAAAAAAASGES